METAIGTQNNLQVVRQAFDDFITGNFQGVIDACTDDVVWSSYDNPDVPFSGNFHGKSGVREFFSVLAETVDYSNFEASEFICDRDYVIVLGHHAGTVKKTGKTFDHDWCFSLRLRDGKISRYLAFIDSREQGEAFK